jgi:hypothetical protein
MSNTAAFTAPNFTADEALAGFNTFSDDKYDDAIKSFVNQTATVFEQPHVQDRAAIAIATVLAAAEGAHKTTEDVMFCLLVVGFHAGFVARQLADERVRSAGN